MKKKDKKQMAKLTKIKLKRAQYEKTRREKYALKKSQEKNLSQEA